MVLVVSCLIRLLDTMHAVKPLWFVLLALSSIEACADFPDVLRAMTAISGNYCQPKCDEPTTEVKFASADQGTLTVRLENNWLSG